MKKFKLFVILGLVMSALLMFCACGKDKLPTPMNVDVTLEDQLTWAEVDNARNYVVEITGENGTIKKLEPKKTTVSLENLVEGNYEIRLKAVSGFSNIQDSDWTETIYFEKGYENGCVYKLINNNTEYAITKYGKANGKISIPDEYRKKPITEIADKAFRGCAAIESVDIGKNVRSIGFGAFQNCKNLVTVTLQEGLTSIGESAFQSCGNLKEINIPTSVTVIEDYAFAYCRSLQEIDLHDSITRIGAYAFSDCSSITKLLIPDSVQTVGKAAFTGNTSLKEVTIGKNVEAIDEETFQMCRALETVTFLSEGDLQSIGKSAFRDCRALESVTIPEGVTTLDNYAFYMSGEEVEDEEGNKELTYTSVLSDITLPSTLTRVGTTAFYGTRYYMDALNQGDYVYLCDWLIGCSDESKATITKINEGTLKSGVIGIADSVFESCPKLFEVEIPSSIKYIGQWSFAFNFELGEVIMNNVLIIHDYAFSGNENLYSVSFGTKLQSIGDRVFSDCTGLIPEYLTLPETLVSIGTESFKNTQSLSGSNTAEVIYAGNKDDGWWVVGYKGNITKVDLKPNTIGIADYAFYRCVTLTWIDNMESLQYIGKSAFYGCSALEFVGGLRNSSVTDIPEHAFAGCVALYSIDLPLNLKSVGRSAFYQCAQLTDIDLAKVTMRVTSIGDYAFYQCMNLKTAALGKHVTQLGKYAFYKCSSLESIVLPEGVTSVADRMFYKCKKLTSVTFGKNVESIGEYAFTGCELLARVRFPSTVKEIKKYAFFNCVELAYITFNESLETIGEYAFYGNIKIVSLELPASLKTIGKYAFKGCNQMTSLLVGENVESIGAHTFYACTDLTIYSEALQKPKKWDAYWNSSYKGVVFGCTLSDDKTYVVSVTITKDTLHNKETATFGAPYRNGYVFKGWSLSDGGEVKYTADQIKEVPIGTTVYAKWSNTLD